MTYYTTNQSAGVYNTERDLSQVQQPIDTSTIAAIVGCSDKGPLERTLINSVSQYIALYGIPRAIYEDDILDPNTCMGFAATMFLRESSQLFVSRVAPSARYAAAYLRTTATATATSFTAGTNTQQSFDVNSGPGLDSGVYQDPKDFDVSYSTSVLCMFYAQNPGEWANSDSSDSFTIDIVPTDTTNFWVNIYPKGQSAPAESFLVNLDYVVDGFGQQLNIEESINSQSMYLRVKQNKTSNLYNYALDERLVNTVVTAISLGGGTNGNGASSATDYQEIVDKWYEDYSNPEDIDVNVLINGGYAVRNVQVALSNICSQRKDCTAIFDVPPSQQSRSSAIAYRGSAVNITSSTLGDIDTNRCMIVSPDILVFDQYSGRNLYVPPSGRVAAVFAKTDRVSGSWFAPAGVSKGQLKDVIGLRYMYDKTDRDYLWSNQINSFRNVKGAGICLWGDLTMQRIQSALSSISVRRLTDLIEKSTNVSSLYMLFDPNTEMLRYNLRSRCEEILNPIKHSQGLYDFSVICDGSNNTAETIARGDVIVDIYIDPVLPAKQIYLTAVVNKTGSTVTVL